MEYPGATESKHHKPILLPPENTRQQISTNAPPLPTCRFTRWPSSDPPRRQTLPEPDLWPRHHIQQPAEHKLGIPSHGTCSQTLVAKWLRFALSSILISWRHTFIVSWCNRSTKRVVFYKLFSCLHWGNLWLHTSAWWCTNRIPLTWITWRLEAKYSGSDVEIPDEAEEQHTFASLLAELC